VVLDLQVIRPKPRIESGGRVPCELVAADLLRKADAAVDALVARARLAEEAVDDHDVLTHFRDGAELLDNVTDPERSLPVDALPVLRALRRPCVRRDHCRLRRLRRADRGGGLSVLHA
jgi:hypothetical protein